MKSCMCPKCHYVCVDQAVIVLEASKGQVYTDKLPAKAKFFTKNPILVLFLLTYNSTIANMLKTTSQIRIHNEIHFKEL